MTRTEIEVTAPDGKVSGHILGSGDPLVMIRGLGRWSIHWHGLDVELSKFFKVVTIDARGLGKTTRPVNWNHEISHLSEDVAFVLDHLKIESANIHGTSLGGMVALDFAIRYPERAKKLCLINSSIGGRMIMRINPLAVFSMAKMFGSDRKNAYINLAKMLTSPATDPKVVEDFGLSWMKLDRGVQPSKIVATQLKAAAAFAPSASVLAAIKIPTMIMIGEDDQFVSPANSIRIHHEMPGSKLAIIPKAGHEPHVDQPQEVVKRLVEFFT